MNIALDISPLTASHGLYHRVRGTGVYVQYLLNELKKRKEHSVTTFSKEEKTPNADIVHYPYFEPFFVTLPSAIFVRSVVTVHDLTPFVFPQHFPVGIRGKLIWQIQKYRLKKAKRIIADSRSSARDIVKYTGIKEEKIKVVYLAADKHFKKVSSSDVERVVKKYNLPKKFVLYVGDATWNKNLPRILEAATLAKVPLVMVGKALVSEIEDANNPWNKDLVLVQKIAKERKDIMLVGYVPDQDLPSLYNAATLCVMPSLYEGFGLPIVEAMVCGSPVVTSKSGSIEEVAQDAAIYADPYKSDDIARCIKDVFEDAKLLKMFSEKGIVQAKKFSWNKTADETISVYKEVLEND